MQDCILYHTGIFNAARGVILEGKVYMLEGRENQVKLPQEMSLAIEECEGGLIQFEVNGKWGFADIYTGDIVIEPIWDYAGPFYHGYAHVAVDAHVETYLEALEDGRGEIDAIIGGRHGYIDPDGDVVIPLIYDFAEDIPYKTYYFKVEKNGYRKIIDETNKTVMNFGSIVFKGEGK